MKIKIRTYLLLIPIVLLSTYWVAMTLCMLNEEQTAKILNSLTFQRCSGVFVSSLFLMLLSFFLNTEFRYDDRKTVYKKNIKYIASYCIAFACVFINCLGSDTLSTKYSNNVMISLILLFVGVLGSVAGIELAILFNKKHTSRVTYNESKLTALIFCSMPVLTVIYNFMSFSRFDFPVDRYKIYFFFFHCFLILYFYKTAQNLYVNGNKRVVITCFPLMLTEYLIFGLSLCFFIFLIGVVPYEYSIDVLAMVGLFFLYLFVCAVSEFIYCFIGILLAKSVHKKADKEKQALES